MERNLYQEKYELRECIGSGGSGSVWTACDRHLKCTVAVKIFEKEAAEAQWEVRMLKELQHPAFPTLFDYMEGEREKWLVMEYVEGKTLADTIREHGRVEQEQAVDWALELSEVLLYLHERKQPLLYRDMKPANIIIDSCGKVRLVDFGTVCHQYGEEVHQSAGTRGYAAPEQFEAAGRNAMDERCDIYSLGATLFHMLTGCNPSLPPFLMQPIRTYDRRLSLELERIIKKATADKKEKRYASVRLLKRELECYRAKDRIRRILTVTGKAAYYGCLLSGACQFLSSWERAQYRQAQALQRLNESKMLWSAVFLVCLCMGRYCWEKWQRRGLRGIRQERNVLLSERKSSGALWLLLWAAVLLTGMAAAKETVLAQESQKEETSENPLFVNVRNEKGQKLLVRYDTEYGLKDTLRLELPLDNFTAGERYELHLDCINRETGERHSRIFYLKGLEP